MKRPTQYASAVPQNLPYVFNPQLKKQKEEDKSYVNKTAFN
jgi:hypothetical protein